MSATTSRHVLFLLSSLTASGAEQMIECYERLLLDI
jgi:hypothetical protein